jgi:hypothetical protein
MVEQNDPIAFGKPDPLSTDPAREEWRKQCLLMFRYLFPGINRLISIDVFIPARLISIMTLDVENST